MKDPFLKAFLMRFPPLLQIVIHAMQCTHYIILWHLAKVSDSSSPKVFTYLAEHIFWIRYNLMNGEYYIKTRLSIPFDIWIHC